MCFRRSHLAVYSFLPLIKCPVKFVPVIHDAPEAFVVFATRRQKKCRIAISYLLFELAEQGADDRFLGACHCPISHRVQLIAQRIEPHQIR